MIAAQIATLLVWLLARARFQRLNRFLFHVSIRGLGILNYRNSKESGEKYFLEQVLACYSKSELTKRGVIFDVGANVGNYSSAILSIAPAAQIYCFEPHPGNARLLESALGTRVTVVRLALGSTPGALELFDYAGSTGSSHASLH